ncbi:hypothetical protein KC361_g2108 [Hortaea werneckii]|nr:hypothetical protein KC361_g2108 [Hortaea werneckii]
MDGAKTSSANSGKQQFKTGGAAAKAMDGARKQAASPVDGQNRKQQNAQPKAWQGPNPITQRASSSMSNGADNASSKLSPQTQKNSGDSNADKHAHDRLLYLLANFAGQDATLTLKNGEQFSGVFSGGAFDSPSKCQYVLKMVKRTKLPAQQQMNGDTELSAEYIGEGEDHSMAFDVQEAIDLSVKDVTTVDAKPMQNGSATSSFRTDTEISRRDGPMPRERELQRWDAGDPSTEISLEDSGEGWDQFAANERMYGIRSDYDENMYTTALNYNDPQYRQKEAQAARIAREIEGSAPTNAHVAEERRKDAEKNDGGMDEEEKYSGVQRDGQVQLPKRGAGSYIPPSQRPITSNPTVPGAPYDPAILSTTKPVAAPAPSPIPQADKTAKPSAAEQKEQPKPSSNEINGRDASAPPKDSPALKPTSQQQPEDHMRSVANAFKEFANMEKLKVRQGQEMKRHNVKQEKNVLLNDLKKFAASFKLNTRVPDDLVPILAKDREKQAEIQKKAEESAKEALIKAEEKKKEQPNMSATPPASSSSQSHQTSAPGTDPRSQFNQHTRSRASQQMRIPPFSGQGMSSRGPMPNKQMFQRAIPPQPLPADLYIPRAPPAQANDRAPLSPASSTGLNVKAFEFKPMASSFTPSGTTPSPQREAQADPPTEPSASFFSKDKKKIDPKERKDIENSFNPVKRMLEEKVPEEHKKSIAANGGIPQPYRTPPTWDVNTENASSSYKDSFPKALPTSQGPSPMHTPNPNGQPMPHAHQLPGHMQQPPQMATPQQRGPSFFGQPHHAQGPAFDPRMQQFAPGGSVQGSPRFAQGQMAFGGQMPPNMHMQMPQFAGQPMPGYGMSPSMGFRQPQMMPGGTPQMGMMMPMQGHGQMPTPQMRQGFPQGPQYGGPPMGGQMMMPNPSGGYMNGPMPQQPYSPMPPHAQPHMAPHMQQGPAGGYAGSPRAGPHMMQHQGSQHGFQPPMGPGVPHQGPPFAPSPGQPHPYHYQRQMSGQGYPVAGMTPRQQQAVPHQPSPGMAGAQGDEGK